MTAGITLPSLSVVIPVYNEPHWIGRTVDDLAAAVARSGWPDVELIVVDDGSAEETRQALARLATPFPLRVIAQENSGRLLARKAGLDAARGELVLLLDSRVSLEPGALRWVAPHVRAGRRVWNGHCLIDTDGNPYARFWDVLTFAAFADYLARPRTTSFGPEEYDRFPKGTTHFLAPRDYLLEAMEHFETYYDDARFVSDDTTLLRHVAERERINISPMFGSLYRSRTALRPFLHQALYRGTTFFDGFGHPGRRFFPAVVAAFPVPVAAALFALRHPRAGACATAAAPLAAAAVPLRWRRPWRHVVSFAVLAPPFAVVYTAGIWRGALMALKARAGR
jgi:glycosyltransferase involved in cell wall biosynthesis